MVERKNVFKWAKRHLDSLKRELLRLITLIEAKF